MTDEHTIYSTSTTCFRPDDLSSMRRTASVGPGLSLMNANDYDHDYGHGIQRPPTYSAFAGPNTAGRTRSQTTRHVNCDFSPSAIQRQTPTPPYYSSLSLSSISPPTPASAPATTLPPALHLPPSLANGIRSSPSNSSLRSSLNRDLSVSRRPSSDEDSLSSYRLSPIRARMSRSPQRGSPYARDTSSTRDASTTRDGSITRVGRARSRFSLTTVLDVVREVAGAVSPSGSRNGRIDVDGDAEVIERGRTKVRTIVPTPQNSDAPPRPSSMQRYNSYNLLGLRRVLGLDRDDDTEDDLQQGCKYKDHGEGWREFKKGRSTAVPLGFWLTICRNLYISHRPLSSS